MTSTTDNLVPAYEKVSCVEALIRIMDRNTSLPGSERSTLDKIFGVKEVDESIAYVEKLRNIKITITWNCSSIW